MGASSNKLSDCTMLCIQVESMSITVPGQNLLGTLKNANQLRP